VAHFFIAAQFFLRILYIKQSSNIKVINVPSILNPEVLAWGNGGEGRGGREGG
jgi:hypothetical protein